MKSFKLFYLIFFFLGSLNAQSKEAPKNFYFKEAKINKTEYFRYIKPQMRSIVSDFYQLLKTHHKFYPQAQKLIQQTRQYSNDLIAWYQKCNKRILEGCSEELLLYYNQLVRLQISLYEVLEKLPQLTSTKSHSLKNLNLANENFLSIYTDPFFELNKPLHKYQSQLSTIINQVERGIATYELERDDFPLFNVDFVQKLNFLVQTSEFWFFAPLPDFIRKDVYTYWKYNILVMEIEIMEEDSLSTLGQKLEALDGSSHLFFMKMGKSNVKLPSSILKFTTVMQRRWNSILKVILN